MKIQVTLEFGDPIEAINTISSLIGGPASLIQVAPAVPAETTSGIVDASGAPASLPQSEQKIQHPKAPTLADVRAAMRAVSKVLGIPGARAVLTKFGVEKMSDLKPEQYAALIAAAAVAASAL